MGIEGNRLLAGMQMHLRAIVGKPFRWKHVCVTHVVPFSASFFFFFFCFVAIAIEIFLAANVRDPVAKIHQTTRHSILSNPF